MNLNELAHLSELPQFPLILNGHNHSTYSTEHAQQDSGENGPEALSRDQYKPATVLSQLTTTLVTSSMFATSTPTKVTVTPL